jgi:hypothetical protein
MATRILTAVCGVIAMLASRAIAAPFEDGVAAYQRGDYAMTLEIWRPLAEAGKWYDLAAQGGRYAGR